MRRGTMRIGWLAGVMLVVGCTVADGQGDRPRPGGSPGGGAAPEAQAIDTSGSVEILAEIWADNWFALYLGETPIAEDSVPITTERSFNAERFVFRADYPLTLNVVARDFRQDDTGLEYIGTGRQQMGDGGFIAQFTDVATGRVIAATDSTWRCLVTHDAPASRACERSANPVPGVGDCGFVAIPEPPGWHRPDFDDSAWDNAREYAAAAVRPRDGYDRIDWSPQARLIWGPDLETNNTLLCRLTVPQ